MERREIAIEREELERHTVLSVSGTVDMRASDDLAAALAGVEHEDRHLVVDLTGVPFMDSTGLSVLVRAGTSLQDRGRRLVLVAIGGPVRRVLEVSGVDQVFLVAPSVEAATAL